jgi:hypothetical protein
MNQKTVLTLSACAVAGVAAIQLTRLVQTWRNKHLRFDFPIDEELFIGWGGGNPRRARRRA